jgi:hypothetical protein
MSHLPHPLASQPVNPARKRTGRRFASLLLAAGLTVGAMTALATSSASAASACPPGTDAENVVTVQLTPTAPRTLVLGIPFAIPPGPPGFPGYSRTSITTEGGVVNIDTFLAPPGTPTWSGLAVVSIHPPGPCRVQTSGTTVVFTPIIPPGPPS